MTEPSFSLENALSRRLKLLRLRRHMTQLQVAKKLHVDRSTYSYLRNRKGRSGHPALLLLSELYGVKIDFIVGNSAKKAPAEKPEPKTAKKS